MLPFGRTAVRTDFYRADAGSVQDAGRLVAGTFAVDGRQIDTQHHRFQQFAAGELFGRQRRLQNEFAAQFGIGGNGFRFQAHLSESGVRFGRTAVFIHPLNGVSGQVFRNGDVADQAVQYGGTQLGNGKSVAQQFDEQVFAELVRNRIAAVCRITFAVSAGNQISRYKEACRCATMSFFQFFRHFAFQARFVPFTGCGGRHGTEKGKFTLFFSRHTDFFSSHHWLGSHIVHNGRPKLRFATTFSNNLFCRLNTAVGGVTAADCQ